MISLFGITSDCVSNSNVPHPPHPEQPPGGWPAVQVRIYGTWFLAVNSNSTPASSNILDSKKLLHSLFQYSKEIALKWIHGHCSVTSKELVDYLAKNGASIQETTRKAIPFTSAKHII
ncbi:hypothetical protein TNCV_4690231 [Trichonephila clavipes]|nr:hypothetical protein TNCV_4690231 [Trichonephila clavipes]